jgi:hypothetical protein
MGYICVTTGVKVRAALLTAVTRKAISLAEVSGDAASDIVGFVAGDIRKVYDGMQARPTLSAGSCPRKDLDRWNTHCFTGLNFPTAILNFKATTGDHFTQQLDMSYACVQSCSCRKIFFTKTEHTEMNVQLRPFCDESMSPCSTASQFAELPAPDGASTWSLAQCGDRERARHACRHEVNERDMVAKRPIAS